MRDVATGTDLADEIPRTRACSLAWTPDGSGFYYTRYPAPGEVPAGEEQYHRGVFHHRLGDDPAQGPQAVRRRARHDRLARRRPVARRPLAGDHRQPGLVEERGLPRRRPRAAARARRRSPPARRRSSTSSRCSTIASTCLTTSGAPRGRLFAVDPAQPERARWREVIPKGRPRCCKDVAYFRGRPRGRLRCRTPRCACAFTIGEGAPRGEIAAARAGRADRARRRARRRRAVLRLHVVPRRRPRCSASTSTTPKAPVATWRKLAGADRSGARSRSSG